MRRTVVLQTIILLTLFVLSGTDTQAIVGDAKAQSTANQWIPVPAWLSGTWQARFQTFLDTYDFRLRKKTLEEPATLHIHRERTIGAQLDESGQIWHYVGAPYVRTSETESYTESQTITRVSVLSSDSTQVKLCTVGEVTRISKPDGDEVDRFYEKTVVTYSPLNEGVIKVDLTITDFDINGHALRQAQSVCVERRVKPFLVIDRDERGELREKFLRFLTERNQAQLNSTDPEKTSE